MASFAVPATREAVLRLIQQSPLKPTRLLTDLGSEYSYTQIQDAVSDLLEDGEVVLTSKLLLQPAVVTKDSPGET
jgi:hypothetical protein